MSGSVLSIREQEALLTLAIILLNVGDENCQELGYRIIVMYGNLLDNYVPLYDVAINKGYIPVLKLIEDLPKLRSHFSERFFNLYASSSAEIYKRGGIYLTYQQRNLSDFFIHNKTNTVAIIAPTSYGKSELIIQSCNDNPNSNICILVPTKALLAQTRQRLIRGLVNGSTRKIITHPEMYNADDDNFIAVLTQERLLRLMRKASNLSFDTVFIDEAHNLLEDDQRSVLLAKTIILLGNRKQETAFKFLTPFLVDAVSLSVRYTNFDIHEFKITENIKTERYYSINFKTDGQLKAYDQFLDAFIIVPGNRYKNEISLIKAKKASKNIVYLNSPPKIERFSKRLLSVMDPIDDPEIAIACRDIAKFLHSDYALIECLRHGFAYHHGSVPDVVRLYSEHLFSNCKKVSIIITSSTLLEGVNIPAEKLFLLEYMKGTRRLSPSQFKNLSGRVCRFSEIFDADNGSLTMLEPCIYVVGSEYVRTDANTDKFLVDSVKVDKVIKDEPINVLLSGTPVNDINIDDKVRADQFLENIQQGITGEKSLYAKTEVGKLCFQNNITEIPIIEYEHAITEELEQFANTTISTPEQLLKVIGSAFIRYIAEDHTDHDKLSRLMNDRAQHFYTMFVKWRMRSASYSQMIKSFLTYWENADPDDLSYVGKWGDKTLEGHRTLWVNISEKSQQERVNLAIVRIKEEQDFLDNTIITFVEILYDLELVDEDMYLKIKYGTADPRKIVLIRHGISNTLSSLLLRKYPTFISIDVKANVVTINPGIIQEMQDNAENSVLIFEVGFYVKPDNYF